MTCYQDYLSPSSSMPTDSLGPHIKWDTHIEHRCPLQHGFTGHSGRVGMAQDLASTGTELPALMTAGRWKNSKMPARYTERQVAGRGAVARYYQEPNQT